LGKSGRSVTQNLTDRTTATVEANPMVTFSGAMSIACIDTYCAEGFGKGNMNIGPAATAKHRFLEQSQPWRSTQRELLSCICMSK
jgi:hypothetical protein